MHRRSELGLKAAVAKRIFRWSKDRIKGASMFGMIVDWMSVIGAIVAPFLLGVTLEHKLYPVERQWAARLGRG